MAALDPIPTLTRDDDLAEEIWLDLHREAATLRPMTAEERAASNARIRALGFPTLDDFAEQGIWR